MLHIRILKWLLIGVCWLPALGSAEKPNASEFYENAVVRVNQGDLKGAIIQLKNALKQDHDMLPAHVLLGKTYLLNNDPAAAEEELKKAHLFGADQSLIILSLAQAYHLQSKYNLLVTTLKPTGLPHSVQADVYLFHGRAYLALRQFDQAKKAFSAAIKLKPVNASATAGLAMLYLQQNQFGQAKRLAQKALQMGPDVSSAWNSVASINHTQGNLTQALREYSQVLALEPKHLSARLARVGLYFDLGRSDDAKSDLAYLRDTFPYEPNAIYLLSTQHARAGDAKQALVLLIDAADILGTVDEKVITANQRLLMLSGLVHYDLKRYESAQHYLSLYVEYYPEQVGARKLLAATLLFKQDFNDAIKILEPALRLSPNDVRVLSMLGVAYMRTGKLTLATELFEQATKLNPNEADITTDLALSYFGSGRSGPAIDTLAKLFAQDHRQIRAGIILAMLYHKHGDAPSALQIAQQLATQKTENIGVLNLLGTLLAANGKLMAARQKFEKILELNALSVAAQINLGKIDLAQNQPEQARDRYQKILNTHPTHLETLIALAHLEDLQGQPDKATRWIEKASVAHKTHWRIRLTLVDYYVKAHRYEEALSTAKAALNIVPSNHEAFLTVARCAMLAGQPDEANFQFKRMISTDPTNPDVLWRVAKAQISAHFLSDAVAALKLALLYRPDFLPAQTTLADTLLSLKRREEADGVIDAIQTRHPALAVTHRLNGDRHMLKQNYPSAAKAYAQAFSLQQTTRIVIGRFQALLKQGHSETALALAQRWLDEHKNDHLVQVALIDAHLQLGQHKIAQTQIEHLLTVLPNQPHLLNNLANLYLIHGDARALEAAQQAYQLVPEDATINDTIGWVLIQTGKTEQGLRYLREAHFRSSHDPDIRYHIAVALVKLGRPTEALEELNIALASKGRFSSQDAAKTLLQRITP